MFSGQQKLSRVFSIAVFSDSSTPTMLSFLFQLKHSRNGSSVVIYIVKYACKRKKCRKWHDLLPSNERRVLRLAGSLRSSFLTKADEAR